MWHLRMVSTTNHSQVPFPVVGLSEPAVPSESSFTMSCLQVAWPVALASLPSFRLSRLAAEVLLFL